MACAGAVLLLAALHGASAGELVLPWAEIDWPRDEAAVSRWAVRAADGDANGAAWRSLVSETADGRPISRHLAAALPGEWLPVEVSGPGDATAPGINRSFVSADGALAMRQILKPLEAPYRFRLTLELTNRESRARPAAGTARIRLGPGIGETPIPGLGIAEGLYSYVEPVVFEAGLVRRFEPDGDAGSAALELDAFRHDDWLGLHSRYFALLIAPRSGPLPERIELGWADLPDPGGLPRRYLPWTELALPVPALPPGESARWSFEVFSGPKSRAALAGDDGIHYGDLLFPGLWTWMRGLSLALLWLMAAMQSVVVNWGLAICLLAVLVRLALYPIARWAFASQQRFVDVQRTIQPQIQAIKKRYKGGEQSERILKLYEQHDVSPLAGLKPLLIVLIQLPIFIALFHVLGQAFELRQASFLWIESLGKPDQLFGFGTDLPFFGAYFNLLPVLMALTTLATIKLSPAPAATPREQRRQNIFLGAMAAGFFILFYPFPAGMVLYWTVANLLHILQARGFQGHGREQAPDPD